MLRDDLASLVQQMIDRGILFEDAQREFERTFIQRALNKIEANFYNRMERVGGFGGKADQLNAYYISTGNPDWFNEDLSRYRALSATDIRAAAEAFLPADRRVELTVVPEGKAP